MESLQESHETDTTKQQRDGPMNTDLNDLSYFVHGRFHPPPLL